MKVLSSLSGVNSYILRLFYVQAIAPVLEYGSIASSLATKTQIDRIQRITNIAMRLILGATKYTRIQTMSNELNMPEFRVKINTRTANITHKIVCNQEHPLHENVSTALQQNPKLFKSTTLTLVTSYREFRPYSTTLIVTPDLCLLHGYRTPSLPLITNHSIRNTLFPLKFFWKSTTPNSKTLILPIS